MHTICCLVHQQMVCHASKHLPLKWLICVSVFLQVSSTHVLLSGSVQRRQSEVLAHNTHTHTPSLRYLSLHCSVSHRHAPSLCQAIYNTISFYLSYRHLSIMHSYLPDVHLMQCHCDQHRIFLSPIFAILYLNKKKKKTKSTNLPDFNSTACKKSLFKKLGENFHLASGTT